MVIYNPSSTSVSITVIEAVVDTTLTATVEVPIVNKGVPFDVDGRLVRKGTSVGVSGMIISISGGSQSGSVVTDANGFYSFPNLVELVAGSYTYTLTFLGATVGGLMYNGSSAYATTLVNGEIPSILPVLALVGGLAWLLMRR